MGQDESTRVEEDPIFNGTKSVVKYLEDRVCILRGAPVRHLDSKNPMVEPQPSSGVLGFQSYPFSQCALLLAILARRAEDGQHLYSHLLASELTGMGEERGSRNWILGHQESLSRWGPPGPG